MSEPFDPYRKWLGIPPKDQPPNHYRLLGIAHFEDDPDVIENAATRQLAHVRMFQAGKHASLSQKVLNELTAAKLCLLNAGKKSSYDEQLRAKLAAEGKLSSENLLIPSEQEADSKDEHGGAERRAADARWKTETEDPATLSPPIVPIPMPVGTAVAAPPRLAPSFPLPASPPVISSSRARYRAKKSASAMVPLALAIIGFLIIIGGGIAALVYSGALGRLLQETPHKKASAAPLAPASAAAKDKNTKERSKSEGTLRPQSGNSGPVSSSPASGSSAFPGSKPHAEIGSLEDQVRQAEFLARSALGERKREECKRQLVTAENLIEGHPAINSKLKAQISNLREFYVLHDKFWTLVREAAVNGRMQAGEKFQFHKMEYVLEGHEGEQVTYKIGERQHVSRLHEMDASAAMALAWQTTRNDKAERLCMVAFAALDKSGGGQERRELAKRLYVHLALQGHTHAGLAKELGIAEKPSPDSTKDAAKDFD